MRLGPLYEGEHAAETEIVGVVGDVLKDGNDATRQPEMYFVHGSRTHRISGFPTFVVRGSASHTELAATLRRLVREIDGGTAIDSVTPLRTLVSASWAQPRFAASVVSGFAVLAIGLAGIGLYGALSYSVSQRRRELGVRAALGATRGALVGLVLREGILVTLAGVGLGIVAASLLTRLMTETALRHVAARRALVLARPGTPRHRRRCGLPGPRSACRIDRSRESPAGRIDADVTSRRLGESSAARCIGVLVLLAEIA